MRFILRATTGLILTVSTLAILVFAGLHLHGSMTSTEARKRPPVRERGVVVDAGVLERTRVAPVVKAFGQVQAWNSLEIRAPAGGPVTEISPNFREGMSIAAGELLFRIDPELAERRVVDAEAALEQAETEFSEAAATEQHIMSERDAAKAEADVRRADLGRKTSLFERKLTTSTARDDAVLALSAAEQSVVAKERELLALKGRIDRAKAGVERARLTLSDARRALKDTSYRAPFAGRLSEVALTLGRRVSENEKLGLLIDPAALEVSFPVRNGDFGKLIDPANKDRLAPLPVKVTLDLVDTEVTAEAVLERPAAVASTQAGRTLYARITGGDVSALRPGDFVSVAVEEPEIADVAVIPADAATLDGRILVIGAESRLEEHKATIVRRQGERLIVADVPFGKSYVARRLPFLARGQKVKAKNAGEEPAREERPVARSEQAGGSEGRVETASLDFDEGRRAQLIAFVKGRPDMPDRVREKLLLELSKPNPERRIVERIERRMTGQEKRS